MFMLDLGWGWRCRRANDSIAWKTQVTYLLPLVPPPVTHSFLQTFRLPHPLNLSSSTTFLPNQPTNHRKYLDPPNMRVVASAGKRSVTDGLRTSDVLAGIAAWILLSITLGRNSIETWDAFRAIDWLFHGWALPSSSWFLIIQFVLIVYDVVLESQLIDSFGLVEGAQASALTWRFYLAEFSTPLAPFLLLQFGSFPLASAGQLVHCALLQRWFSGADRTSPSLAAKLRWHRLFAVYMLLMLLLSSASICWNGGLDHCWSA